MMSAVVRRHTKNGMSRFNEALCQAVKNLGVFQEMEGRRVRRFQITEVSDDQALAVMMRAYERQVVSSKMLPDLLSEWRRPSFQEFAPRTLWSLENAFTTCLGNVAKSNPQRFCGLSISLQGLLGEVAGLDDSPAHAPRPA